MLADAKQVTVEARSTLFPVRKGTKSKTRTVTTRYEACTA